jgi:hypothetical protein
MESIKRFLLEERASSEAASSVILIAGVASILVLGVMAYYGAMNNFFNAAENWIGGAASAVPPSFTPPAP